MPAPVYVNGAALTRLSSRRVARHGQDPYPALWREYQVAVPAEGLMSRTADAALSFAWSAFTAIEETERRFPLIGHGGEVEFALPKHGLPDRRRAGPLRDLIGARTGLARGPPRGALRATFMTRR